MNWHGNLSKMGVTLDAPVSYRLALGDDQVLLSDYLGKTLKLAYEGKIECTHCGRKTNKSFQQGYCYPCFKNLAQCDSCIVSPEKCHFHLGTCREPEWGEAHCMRTHYVYLANSSGLKVGITRAENIPSRWIDQGAVQAVPIFKVDSRYISGLSEVIFKQHVSDRTSWQAMLKGSPAPLDMRASAEQLLSQCHDEIAALQSEYGLQAVQPCTDAEVVDIQYPVLRYPEKVKSFNLDKTPVVEGQLQGIKGQYLIFDTGVINIRKFTGYQVALTVS